MRSNATPLNDAFAAHVVGDSSIESVSLCMPCHVASGVHTPEIVACGPSVATTPESAHSGMLHETPLSDCPPGFVSVAPTGTPAARSATPPTAVTLTSYRTSSAKLWDAIVQLHV